MTVIAAEPRATRRCAMPPVFTFGAIAVLIAVHVLVDEPERLALQTPTPKPWHFATALVAHTGIAHLASNIVGLAICGTICEIVHGWLRTAIVASYGGVMGMLGYAAYNATRSTKIVGASPAVFALEAAFGSHLFLNWSETRFARLWALTIVILIVFEFAAWAIEPLPNVAYSSHIAGAVNGLLIGMIVLRNEVVRNWERCMQAFAVFVSMAIVGFCVWQVYVSF
jgi:membrane associated rhomboid family serine protease